MATSITSWSSTLALVGTMTRLTNAFYGRSADFKQEWAESSPQRFRRSQKPHVRAPSDRVQHKVPSCTLRADITACCTAAREVTGMGKSDDLWHQALADILAVARFSQPDQLAGHVNAALERLGLNMTIYL
jgi:hypothetical protein